MQLRDAIKEMVHRNRGWTQAILAEKAGFNSVSSVSTPIKKNDMHVSTLVRIANAAGYDLKLVRRSPLEPEYPIDIDPVIKTKKDNPILREEE